MDEDNVVDFYKYLEEKTPPDEEYVYLTKVNWFRICDLYRQNINHSQNISQKYEKVINEYAYHLTQQRLRLKNQNRLIYFLLTALTLISLANSGFL